MTNRLAILAAAFALTACGSSMADSSVTGAAVGPGGPCGPAAARTLASSNVARVYSKGGKVYGCSSRGQKSYVLGGTGNCNGGARVAPVAVAGELAGYGLQRCGVDFGSSQVTVRRLTDGRQLRAFAATTKVLPEAFQSVRSIALKSNGAVAWIGAVSSVIGGRSAVEVHKADSNRPAVLLDTGAGIVPNSLGLHGSRLFWRHGAAARTATLS